MGYSADAGVDSGTDFGFRWSFCIELPVLDTVDTLGMAKAGETSLGLRVL